MKNIFIAILLLVSLAGAFYWVSQQRLSLEGVEGRMEKTLRGDLTLPITATGTIEPARRVELKSEASGEVVEIAKHPGDRVRAGDLLIRLQRDDEQRNVNKAQQDLNVAEARLETARLVLEQARTVDILRAEAQIKQIEENIRSAKFRKDKFDKMAEHLKNEEEALNADVTYQRLLADLAGARADLERAKLVIPRSEQDVKQAEATHESARNTLADAEKRLAKTDIVAPIDGVVSHIGTQVGEVIQGGKTTFQGGTVLAVILDMDRMIARAEVDEADISRVREIAPAWAQPGNDGSVRMPDDLTGAATSIEHKPVITVEATRDEKYEGVIERMYPEPRSERGVITYWVDVVVTSENRRRLLSGMRAEVRFTSQHVSDVVLCPNEAIREGPSGRLGVYVPKPGAPVNEHQTQFLPCTFGLDNGNYSEVLEGLTEGTEVYTRLPAAKSDSKEPTRRRG